MCILNYKKDGTPFYNQFFLMPLHDEAGKVLYFLGVSKDIPSKADHQESLNKGWYVEGLELGFVVWLCVVCYVLCCAVLCCAMLCCVVLCCELCCAVLCCSVL